MSESSQPTHPRPHSIRLAAIGHRLKSGHGCTIAKLIWWTILGLDSQPAWRTNADLGMDVGLMWSDPEVQAQRAVRCLRNAGMVETPRGTRPDAKRGRPASLVVLMAGMHVLAAHEAGERPSEWTTVPASRGELRRFVGASSGSGFAARLRALERLGLVELGEGVRVAPPGAW